MSENVGRRVTAHLELLYPNLTTDSLDRLAAQLLEATGTSASSGPVRAAHAAHAALPSSDEVVLITYADTVVEPNRSALQSLASFWQVYLAASMSTVHVLPFLESTSDGGFSIADYRTITAGFGSWEDLAAVVPQGELMVDLVCNHGSAQSDWFRNFQAGAGYGHDFFRTVPANTDVSSVVRPRTHDLLVPFETSVGVQHVWATFSADQVDFDFSNPSVLVEFCSIIGFYLDRGATRIRLDAIAYLWKELGTACVHLPQTHEVVKLFRTLVQERDPHVLITTETNVPHDRNISYFGDGDEAHMVYNFTLAPLIVWSVLAQSAAELTDWLSGLASPPAGCTFLNFIASHDGIGVRPLEGILSDDQVAIIIEQVQACGGSWSPFSTPEGDRPYELNVSLTDLLAGQDLSNADRFVAAHAVLLCLQGVPAIYIHSLLSSPGDHQAVLDTGHKRDINRSRVRRSEVDERLSGGAAGAIFDRMSALIRLRRAQSAFDPASVQVIHNLDRRVVAVERRSADQRIVALHNVSDDEVVVALPAVGQYDDLVSGTRVVGVATLAPWQVAWLELVVPGEAS